MSENTRLFKVLIFFYLKKTFWLNQISELYGFQCISSSYVLGARPTVFVCLGSFKIVEGVVELCLDEYESAVLALEILAADFFFSRSQDYTQIARSFEFLWPVCYRTGSWFMRCSLWILACLIWPVYSACWVWMEANVISSVQ